MSKNGNQIYSLCRWLLATVLIGAAALTGAQETEGDDEDAEVTEQTELEDAPVVPQQVVEEIVVTGSRIARTPGELAGNLVVLGEEFIEATGGSDPRARDAPVAAEPQQHQRATRQQPQ